MKLRIASRVNNLGRRYYVEKEYKWLFSTWWANVGNSTGYSTENVAKAFAADYAKGDWISDIATF